MVLKSPLVRQPSWSRTFIAPSSNTARNGEAGALQVLAEILGGGPTSRLYRALIVDSKVAASAGAWYSAGALDLGSFGLNFSPRPGGEIEKVEAAMAAEIKRLLTDGVTEEEVARAKKSLRAGAIYVRDSLGAGPNIIGRALTTGRTIGDVESWPERIGAVTREQVDAAARAVLQDKKSVTSVLLPEPSG